MNLKKPIWGIKSPFSHLLGKINGKKRPKWNSPRKIKLIDSNNDEFHIQKVSVCQLLSFIVIWCNSNTTLKASDWPLNDATHATWKAQSNPYIDASVIFFNNIYYLLKYLFPPQPTWLYKKKGWKDKKKKKQKVPGWKLYDFFILKVN
jgi:hypothetical protein